MSTQRGKGLLQVLVEAAVNIWAVNQTTRIHGETTSGMARWDMIRRWAAALAYRLGRIAIYAEHKYNSLKAY